MGGLENNDAALIYSLLHSIKRQDKARLTMTDENTVSADSAAQDETKQVQFATRRIYVKDLSFEAPNGVMATNGWQPKVSQDLNTKVNRVGDDMYEVVLNITVTVNTQDDKTAFLVEVHQAGLFSVAGIDGGPLQQLLSSQCPHILFPYAREAIDNMIVRGGFPPLMMPPINFDALYAKAMDEARKQAASAPLN